MTHNLILLTNETGMFDYNQYKFVMDGNSIRAQLFNDMNIKEQLYLLTSHYYNPNQEPVDYIQCLNNNIIDMYINNVLQYLQKIVDEIIQEVSNNQNETLV
jgi:protein-tyrosine phosphatase